MSSPIEAALLKALHEHARRHHVWLFDFTDGKSHGEFRNGTLHVTADDYDPDEPDCSDDFGAEWHLYAQTLIDSYKVDFVVETTYGAVIVECDGHDWHDRTKQQAAYDRARDRLFLLHGVPTIRFTGSEIHHSADKCANEVFLIAQAHDRQASALAHSGWLNDGTPLGRVE